MLTRIVFIALLPMLVACEALENLKNPTGPDAPEEAVPLPPEEALQALEDMGIPYSQSSFIASAAQGNLEVVRLFVWAGMSPNVQPYTARTVLVPNRENPTTLDHLDYSWFPQEGEEDNDTALMKAAYGGHLEVVKFLLANWADIKAENQQGETVLTFAAAGGHLDVVKFLMEGWLEPCMEACQELPSMQYYAADEDCRRTCTVPMHDAPSYTWDALIHGPKTHVQWAAYNGHREVLEYMLPILKRKDVYFLNTVLDAAALGGQYLVVHYLVHGVTTSRLNSSLMVASYVGNVDIVNTLLKAGANIGWRRSSWIGLNTPEGRLYFEEIGFGALHAAIQAGHDDVLRILLEHWMTKYGADGRDEYGMTALMFAAAGGDAEMSKTLIDNGAPVNGQSDIGMTALMFAAEWNRSDIVAVLLAEGADASLVSAYGDTALGLAEENGHEDIVEMLR
ncbi:MAG: ankyrin repeat domain-containing protein [Gemmatimonadetes bacterium]|nr:ankyrin repeat domain-containing protein [Gemmatimonadota bacterium]